jgi:hypothetical protein
VAQGRNWPDVTLVCDPLLNRGTRIGCESGSLDVGGRIPLQFSYDLATDGVEAALLPAAGERWRVVGRPARGSWQGRADVQQGSLVRLAPFLPSSGPAPTGGRVSGTFDVAVSPKGEVDTDGRLAISDASFSDKTGLHAGEKLAGTLQLAALERDGAVRFRSRVEWNEGEVFWQPLYLKGGLVLSAEGTLDARRVVVESGRVQIRRVGDVTFSASWDRSSAAIVSSAGGGEALAIRGIYEELAKPFLVDTVAADMRTEGTADLGWRVADGALKAFYLNLHRASFEDRNRRFALFDIDAAIPWERTGATRARADLAGAEVLRVPIGRVEIPIELDGFLAHVPKLSVPVLDGELQMHDFVARREDGAWAWQFAGGITPVSVEALTRALGVHVMYGTFSAVIPEVRYAASTVAVDGALLFQVFDGTVVVNDLSLLDPLGRIPRLHASLDMRNLDLDLVTRTFSFGSMTGRIDATLDGLELANWRPVKFDAWVGSSPGSYTRRSSSHIGRNAGCRSSHTGRNAGHCSYAG